MWRSSEDGRWSLYPARRDGASLRCAREAVAPARGNGHMGPMSRRLMMVLLAACLAAVPARAGAAWTGSPRVTVELVSEGDAVAPGKTFWIGLRQTIAPGWHTYWINPGDSGEPPQIDWALPAGFSAGAIAWPHPERIRVGPAMSYGYSNEVVLPIPVTAPADLVPGARVTLSGRASWLVCEKECIPEEAPVSLTLAVAAGEPGPHPTGAPLIARARQALPSPSPWPASFTATPETVTFTVAARGLAPERIAEVWFYPARWGAIDHAAPQQARVDARGITVEVARGQLPEATAAPIDGVLVLTERLDGGTARQAFTLRATPGATATSGVALLQAVALALAGGLLLNLMPCVLPVLSVKALGAGPARDGVDGGDAATWPGLHRGRAPLVRRGGGNTARAPRWGRADRLGLSAPVAARRDAPRLPVLRHGAGAVRRLRDRRSARRRGAGAGGAARLWWILLHGRARRRRGHAVHGAVHGGGGRLRRDPALGHGPPRLRGARPRARAAVSAADADPGLAALPAAAGRLDEAARGAPGLPALCVGGVARLGAEPAGRADGRGRGARRSRPDRARGVALPGLAGRERDVAPRGPDRSGRAGGGRGGPRPARGHGTGSGSGAGGGRSGRGLQPSAPRGAARAGPARVRERHRRMVHHLSRE